MRVFPWPGSIFGIWVDFHAPLWPAGSSSSGEAPGLTEAWPCPLGHGGERGPDDAGLELGTESSEQVPQLRFTDEKTAAREEQGSAGHAQDHAFSWPPPCLSHIFAVAKWGF